MIRALRAFAAVLVAVVAAVAQERSVVHTVSDREVCSVRATPCFGASGPGGFGFLTVVAENRDGAPHLVEVEFASHDWGSSSVAVHRQLLLGPHELGRCVLPLPTTTDRSHRLDIRVDGVEYPGTTGGAPREDLVGLLVATRSDREPWALTVMQAMRPDPKSDTTVTAAPPEDLPADWRLFTGFTAVVVDGRARVAEDVQDALVHYAQSGGRVVVGEADRLPAGALRELCRGAGASGVVACGLGHCVTVAGDGDTTQLRARLGALPRVDQSGWPAPGELLREQIVPGLGDAPLLVFLAVILVFALVVGPLNFLLLRRWRRPLLVLVTVPVCGLGTTLLMLGYGLVHDGLGVRGIVTSWTLLDQERHEATSLAARTLFAGLSPATLTVPNDGFLIAPRACARSERRSPDRWQFDPVAGELDGGVLPSRRATPLLSAQHGIARQRLRARSDGNGGLELLVDGGVAPRGPVLLCDPDGKLWAGEAPRLTPVADDAARSVLEQWQQAAAGLVVRQFRTDGDELLPIHAVLARFLPERRLPPGTYLARVDDAPWIDEHGLAVDYDQCRHYVVGRLAAEDFGR